MRPFGSPRQLEKRRHKAMEFLDSGLSLNEVARKIGCNASSVMRWRDARRKHGQQGLESRPVPGRPLKLSAKERKRLIVILLRGAMANGYKTELWTTARIAELIERRFGITYHPDHIGRLMFSLGWSYQKPGRRPLQRDEKFIEQWKQKEWPRIKKTPSGWEPISSSSTNRASC